MRKLTFLAALALPMAVLPALSGPGQGRAKGERPQKPDPKKVKELMRRKLVDSQKILEGISLNDFKLISKHADDLVQITKDPGWMADKTQRHKVFTDEFRRGAEALSKAAKDKNIDRASLTYLEMTLTCFNCHRYARDQGWIGTDLEAALGGPSRPATGVASSSR